MGRLGHHAHHGITPKQTIGHGFCVALGAAKVQQTQLVLFAAGESKRYTRNLEHRMVVPCASVLCDHI